MHRVALGLVAAAISALAQEAFYRFTVDQDRLSGAPDFSFLNQPLTAADRIFVKGPHFYRVGPDLKVNTRDDQRVRFFGVNLAFSANFPAEADAARVAKRLRRLGANVVRLHHMDTSPDANPEECRSILTTGPYPTFNPIAVARLRRFLDALRAEGIYVNLNLHVGYQFRPAVDQVPGPTIPTQSKPLHVFYPRMIELQDEFTRQIISRLKLKDDPVLAMVEINNESSLLWSWQTGGLERDVTGAYREELERQRKGAELVPFLIERDRYYLRRMLQAVRESTDGWVPVAGTQIGFGGALLTLDSHADLDYQDNHFYIDHYNFPNARWDARDWRIRDASATANLTTYLNLAAAREAGKPYTVSEFNQNWPNRHAAEIDPTIAAFGAFQDWDGLMHFAYSHNRNWDGAVPSGFDLNSDWTKWVNFGQSAWLFRTGAVAAGKAPMAIPVPEKLRLEAGRERRITAFLQERIGYDPNLALQQRVAADKRGGGSRLAKAVAPYRSDTGELLYDQGVYIVQSPQAAGVFGAAGQRRVEAGDVAIQLAPNTRGFAAILVTPLDGKPIRTSGRLLITNPGYTLATVPGTDRRQRLVQYPGTTDWWTIESDTPDKPSASRNGGAPPVWLERVEAILTLRSNARSLTVYPLDGAGQRMQPITATREGDGFRIPLNVDAPWFEALAP